MTKTKTTTLSAAAESRRALDHAEAEHARLTASADQVAAAVEELASRLDRGDETVTAIGWATAHAEQEISARLVAWAATQVKAARERLVNDDTRLADLLAPLLVELFGGHVQVTTTGNPAEAVPIDDGTPVLRIVQTKATTVSGGTLSGVLDLVYLRSALLAPLDSDRVETEARRAGYAVRIPAGVSSRRHGDSHRDDLRVSVLAAAPAVPLLDQPPTQEHAREVGRVVNAALLAAVSGPTHQPNTYGNGPRPASSNLTASQIVSTKTGPDGTVVTIESTHQLTPSPLVEAGRAHHRISAATVPDLVGTVVPGAGRITAAEVGRITIPSDNPARPVTPWEVEIRLHLTHQV